MVDLGDTLARLGLSQYFERFVQEGFDTWETVLDITESDLEALEVRLGHRRRLQREIASSRGQSTRQPLGSPTRLSRPPLIEDRILDREERAVVTKRDNVGSGKRKYRRHPKADENAPERASSAYVIFSNKIREDIKDQALSFTEIAKFVGERWQVLPAAEKEFYESQALAAKEKYSRALIEYKKTAPYREYMEYLAEFKAKTAKGQTGKRAKLDNQERGCSSSKPSRALPPSRVRGGSMSSVGTYDSVTDGQTSPSIVNLNAPMLGQPSAVDPPLKSLPTPTKPDCGNSAMPSHQQGDTAENTSSLDDPYPDYPPSVQKLHGVLLVGARRQGSLPHGRVADPSSVTQTAAPLSPLPKSPMKPNHDSSMSSSSPGYNTSPSPLYTPVTPQEDPNGRIQRALPPLSANPTSPLINQVCVDSHAQSANLPRARYQSLSPFQIPPLLSRTTTIVGIKERDSEEGSSATSSLYRPRERQNLGLDDCEDLAPNESLTAVELEPRPSSPLLVLLRAARETDPAPVTDT